MTYSIYMFGLGLMGSCFLQAAEPQQEGGKKSEPSEKVVAATKEKVLTEAEKKRVKELEAKLTEVGYFNWAVISSRALSSSITNKRMELELLTLKKATSRLKLGLMKNKESQREKLMKLALEDAEKMVEEAKKYEAKNKKAEESLEEGLLILEQREKMFERHRQRSKELNEAEEKLRKALMDKSESVETWLAELRKLKGETESQAESAEPNKKIPKEG